MSSRPLACPECRTDFEVADLGALSWVVCPNCQQRLRVQEALACVTVWYYTRDNQHRVGPFSWPELRQLAARGGVQRTTWVCWQGAPRWYQAGVVPNLFPPEPPSLTPAPLQTPVRGASDSDVMLGEASPPSASQAGPLSMKGIRVQPLRSITLGDFQVFRKLGNGAMAGVYQAWQRSQKRPVALKILSKHLAVQPAFVERFFREAEMMSTLEHPNVVRFFGVGKEEDFAFFAMELVEGFTTDALLQRRGGRLSVGDAVHIALVCARALQYVHDRDIVHRDIKPTNIMINNQGQIKITDLGLAKPVQEELSLTASGVGVGTPEYMAPEQFHNAKRPDRRSDIYALGGVLYDLVTGKKPFNADSMVTLFQIKERGKFPSARKINRDVPARLDLIIDKMLAKDLAHRYASCTEVIKDLESLGVANATLSFNPLQSVPTTIPPDGPDRVEILLVQDDPLDILVAQEGLDEGSVPSNLSVVGDVGEAMAFLRQEGKYATACRPNLIIFGRGLLERGEVDAIAAIKKHDALRTIPLIVLTTASGAADVLRARGLAVSVKITSLTELGRLHDFIDQEGSRSTVAVVEVPGGR